MHQTGFGGGSKDVPEIAGGELVGPLMVLALGGEGHPLRRPCYGARAGWGDAGCSRALYATAARRSVPADVA